MHSCTAYILSPVIVAAFFRSVQRPPRLVAAQTLSKSRTRRSSFLQWSAAHAAEENVRTSCNKASALWERIWKKEGLRHLLKYAAAGIQLWDQVRRSEHHYDSRTRRVSWKLWTAQITAAEDLAEIV